MNNLLKMVLNLLGTMTSEATINQTQNYDTFQCMAFIWKEEKGYLVDKRQVESYLERTSSIKGDPLEWAQMWKQLGNPLDEQTRREISQTYFSKSKQEDVVFVSKIKVFP